MSRTFPSARDLFARLVPGASARPADDTSEEHHRAVREAFLTAASLEPARPLSSVTTPIPADASETTGAAAPVAIPIVPATPAPTGGPVAAAPARVAIPIVPATPAPTGGPVAAAPARVAIPIVPATPAPTGGPVAAAPARVAIPIVPATPAPTGGPVAAAPVPQRRAPTPVPSPTTTPPETPSQPGRPLTGKVAPDNVVRPTRNVDRATDDFFGGLVRRVDDR